MSEQPQQTIADLLDPAEIAEAQKEQQAMIRAALGDQHAAWLKSRKVKESQVFENGRSFARQRNTTNTNNPQNNPQMDGIGMPND